MTTATLYTDASFWISPDKSEARAGWAVWCRTSIGRIVASGRCPNYITCNNAAELSAIFAGVHLISRNWTNVSEILVVSDSQVAIRWLDLPVSDLRGSDAMRTLRGKIDIIRASGLKLQTRWVKGHQSVDTRPAYVNRAVDRLASKAVREPDGWKNVKFMTAGPEAKPSEPGTAPTPKPRVDPADKMRQTEISVSKS